MINFSSKHSNFRLSANKFIAEYFKPFQEKSIVQFSQSITFGHNQMSSIGSSAKVSEYFNKYKIPIFCSDESGRILDEGIYTNKILEATYRECALIFPLLPTVGKRFGLNYGKNSLYILEKDIDCQHLYTLHFDVEENIFLHWSLNNGQFIKDLIENYKLKGKDLILESKCYKNRSSRNSFNAATLKEYYPVSNSKKKKLLSLLHKNSNLPIFLSRQQTNCLILLISGKSAKQIGIELNLSPRTVEDYLQTVREMLGCSTGKELISTYYNPVKEHMHLFSR